MIVASKDDVILLRGCINKNEWLSVKALAVMLLKKYTQGILIDCTELTEVSEAGAKTFLDAMRDIRSEGARVIVVNLPTNVYQVVKSVPGVRSQLPIARSIEEGRHSLLHGGVAGKDADRSASHHCVLVPLLEGFDADYALVVAARVAQEHKASISIVAPLIVSRNLPLMSPLPEKEAHARKAIEQAEIQANRLGIKPAIHIERMRDIEEGLLQMIRSFHASHIVIGLAMEGLNDEGTQALLNTILHRAQCNVTIARQAPAD